MENFNEESPSLFDLSIDESSQYSLEQSAKWARFLTIVFICCAVILLLVFAFAGTAIVQELSYRFGMGMVGSVLMIAVFFILAVFAVFIVFLYRFSLFTSLGIRANNQEDLEKGIGALKIYLILGGVSSILGLVLTLIGIIK